ncbi:hypothetical protein GVN24_31135 [Rhizobium sp. CRIBSB]|nr:hypothetical protein [Rhizobium sp. CRIBSB]
MISLAHIKQRLGQYGAAWLIAFLVSGAAILIGMAFDDMMVIADLVLPVGMAAVGLAMGAGLVATWLSGQTLGTKLVVLFLALLLVLPLLWAPVSAAVVIALFADRSIEYSQVYAGFQIAVAELLFPLSEFVFGPSLFEQVWKAFEVVASIVGFISAFARVWPMIRRLLGPEPRTPSDQTS